MELNCLDPHLVHSQKTLPSSTFFLIPGSLSLVPSHVNLDIPARELLFLLSLGFLPSLVTSSSSFTPENNLFFSQQKSRNEDRRKHSQKPHRQFALTALTESENKSLTQLDPREQIHRTDISAHIGRFKPTNRPRAFLLNWHWTDIWKAYDMVRWCSKVEQQLLSF